MTGPEHYQEAERRLAALADPECDYDPAAISLAQVHATLALAAATALNASRMPSLDLWMWAVQAGQPDTAADARKALAEYATYREQGHR